MFSSTHSSSPKVSVIIVNWNQWPLLKACLQSLEEQSFQDFEVIVVDNGSTDGSAQKVRGDFPQTQLIALDDNVGFCVANNLAIGRVHGRYVALLNNDTVASPDWLHELSQALDRHPEVGFCASKVLLWENPELVDVCGDYFTVEGVADKIGHNQPARLFTEEVEVFGASAAAAIYRRSMLEDIGLFDEDFFMTHEDSDLSFRAQLMGYHCLFVPTAIVQHHLSKSIGASSDFHYRQSRRNVEFVFLKNMPMKWLVKYSVSHVAANAILFISDVLHGRAVVYLQAKISAFQMLPGILKKRRKIQADRRASDEYIMGILTHGWFRQKIRNTLRSWAGTDDGIPEREGLR